VEAPDAAAAVRRAALVAPPRDDSGEVGRTLLRGERAAWMKEGRGFRIWPRRRGRTPNKKIHERTL